MKNIAVAFVLAILVTASQATPLETVHFMDTQWGNAGPNPQRPPKRHEVHLIIPSDLRGEIWMGFWYQNAFSNKPNKGKVIATMNVMRDTDGDGQLDETRTFRVREKVRHYSCVFKVVLPVEVLRAGDLVHASYRFKSMPKIPSSDSARIGTFVTTNPTVYFRH